MKPIRILHLEDDAADAEMLAAMLETDGIHCDVTRVDNEEDYARELEKNSFDLILSDFSLPAFDGLSGLRIARQKAPRTPYIFVSGAIGEERAIESLKQGATDYILKDRLSRFVPAVRRALQDKEERESRLRAEKESSEKERRFRSFIETTQAWIWEINSEGEMTYNNPSVDSMLGYSPEELLGKDRFSLIHEDDHQAALDVFWSSVKEQKGWSGVLLRWKRRDGSYRWFESNSVPILTEAGSVAGFRGSDGDVTERKRSEDTIRDQAALLNVDPDAISVCDLEGKILFWSKGAERMVGWTSSEVVGKVASDFWPKEVWRVLEGARTAVLKQSSWKGELQQTTKDGRELTVESHWTLVRDEKGNPKTIYVVNSDMTERKMMQKQFLRAQRMESIGTLAGGIAHDLNNVLGPILLATHVLKKGVDPSALRIIETVEKSARRGAEMVKQILTFARGVEGQRLPINLRDVVEEMQKIVDQTFPKSVEVKSQIQSDLWTVSADSTQIHQVLLNLCVNARDAMPSGGIISITLENVTLDEQFVRLHNQVQTGQYVLLRVADTGEGIPQETMEKIFDPFFTTKGIGKGTGLGLSTVVSIVKNHGGFIDVSSDVGKGTTFKIYFPALFAAAGMKGNEGTGRFPSGKGETILVVDDEASFREIAKETLENFGYQAITASDGAEAIVRYAENRGTIALVLTDMMMPFMDGLATIKALRRINPSIKVVATSGLIDKPQLGHQIGANVTLLQKPYTAEQLLHALNSALNSDAQ